MLREKERERDQLSCSKCEMLMVHHGLYLQLSSRIVESYLKVGWGGHSKVMGAKTHAHSSLLPRDFFVLDCQILPVCLQNFLCLTLTSGWMPPHPGELAYMWVVTGLPGSSLVAGLEMAKT